MESDVKSISTGRRWTFRLVLWAVLIGLPLVAAELFLRFRGRYYPTEFFQARTIEGRNMWVDNPSFAFRFFPKAMARMPQPVQVETPKPEGVTRILVLGESAAMGDPDPAFGFARYLEVLLQARLPERKWEVINAAMTAINSHAIREIAAEGHKLEADFWVVYAGNNEVMGPFGPGSAVTAADLAGWRVRWSLALQKFALGQWWMDRIRPAGREGANPEWGGMEMFQSNRLDRLDPRLAAVRRNFGDNLSAIGRTGRTHGARVLMGTVGVNVRDSAPFSGSGKMDPGTDAFRAGTAAIASGDSLTASNRLWEALEADVLRFRVDRRLNDVIRESARGQGAVLVEAERALASASAHGLPGDDLFWEHVHLRPAGNHLLAQSFASAIAAALGVGDGAWISAEECGRRLGMTEAARWRQLNGMRARLNRAPFIGQLNHTQRDEALKAELESLRPFLRPTSFEPQAAVLRAAMEVRTNDWMLEDQMARLADAFGDSDTAVKHWRRVVELRPFALVPRYELGSRLAARVESAEEAERHLRAALSRRENFPEAWNQLGQALGQQRRWADADRAFVEAIRWRSGYTEARVNRGLTMLVSGAVTNGIVELREAAGRDTNSATAQLHLARALEESGQPGAAVKPYLALASLRPRNPQVRMGLAGALLASGQPALARQAYLDASALQPDLMEAKRGVARALAAEGRAPEAVPVLMEVIAARPDWVPALIDLGVALVADRRLPEALMRFEKALELDPNNLQVRKYVADVRELLRNEGKPKP